jgi:hypothetical protein
MGSQTLGCLQRSRSYDLSQDGVIILLALNLLVLTIAALLNVALTLHSIGQQEKVLNNIMFLVQKKITD